MIYSTIIQTYMYDGGDIHIIGGRHSLRNFFLSLPPVINSNSFLPQIIKNVLDCAIINKKHICNYQINKANIYLSHIFENIILIIGKCYMSALCLVYGVQLACSVHDETNKQ
jgi:hypothetical protein